MYLLFSESNGRSFLPANNQRKQSLYNIKFLHNCVFLIFSINIINNDFHVTLLDKA